MIAATTVTNRLTVTYKPYESAVYTWACMHIPVHKARPQMACTLACLASFVVDVERKQHFNVDKCLLSTFMYWLRADVICSSLHFLLMHKVHVLSVYEAHDAYMDDIFECLRNFRPTEVHEKRREFFLKLRSS